MKVFTIIAGQAVPDSEYVVCLGGDYAEDALVLCGFDVDHPLVSYHAVYVATGKNVGDDALIDSTQQE